MCCRLHISNRPATLYTVSCVLVLDKPHRVHSLPSRLHHHGNWRRQRIAVLAYVWSQVVVGTFVCTWLIVQFSSRSICACVQQHAWWVPIRRPATPLVTHVLLATIRTNQDRRHVSNAPSGSAQAISARFLPNSVSLQVSLSRRIYIKYRIIKNCLFTYEYTTCCCRHIFPEQPMSE